MRSPERLRAVVVGAGLMGRWHADAAVRAGGRLAAIVDSDRQRAGALAARFRDCAANSSLTATLNGTDVQVVHLCTPTETHEALAREALEAGCHVLVEKPLAPTLAATQRLLDAAAAHNVLVCPCHQFLFQRGVLRAFASLSGLGAVRHVDVIICSAGADGRSGPERDEIAIDILPHAFSLCVRVLAARFHRMRWEVLHPVPGELRLSAGADGVTAGITISMSGRPPVNRLRIIAERGSFHCDLFHGYAIVERGTVSRMWKILRPFAGAANDLAAATVNLVGRLVTGEVAYPGLRELVGGFYLAVREGDASPIRDEETLAVAAARDAVIAAIRTR